jgi:hypothetical protein
MAAAILMVPIRLDALCPAKGNANPIVFPRLLFTNALRRDPAHLAAVASPGGPEACAFNELQNSEPYLVQW